MVRGAARGGFREREGGRAGAMGERTVLTFSKIVVFEGVALEREVRFVAHSGGISPPRP